MHHPTRVMRRHPLRNYRRAAQDAELSHDPSALHAPVAQARRRWRAASVLEIEPGELTRVFVAPPWLRDAGLVAWLLVGIVLIVVGAIWLLALTHTIVVPVIVAMIIAAVCGPVVAALQRHGVPRAGGAALMLLAIVLLGVLLGVIVLGGITSQASDISSHLSGAADKISKWLKDLGVGDHSADHAKDEAKFTINAAGKVLLNGLAHGIEELASLAVFVSFTVLSLFFLLKDGPTLRSWLERHSGVSPPVAHTITGQTLRALRGYFSGMTIVAGFSALIVGGGALIIGVPLAGTIAIVTFLGGYIPYLGAWTAGAFAVLIALGSQGAEGAIAMAIIALLANGALQQLVQPIAYGATLGLHPLAVLILTIAGGSLFGLIGLVLAAPIASAIVGITRELAGARAAAEAEEEAAAAAAAPAGGRAGGRAAYAANPVIASPISLAPITRHSTAMIAELWAPIHAARSSRMCFARSPIAK
jgi:predicted PurR-regulated permease PerM